MAKRKFIEDSDEDDEEPESPALAPPSLRVKQNDDDLANLQKCRAATGILGDLWSVDTSVASTGVQLASIRNSNQC